MFRSEGGRLLAWEDVDDLVQGVHVRALEAAAGVEFRSAPEWRGWLFTLARQQIGKRAAYWQAMKRDARRLLRLTWHGISASASQLYQGDPSTPHTGPVTFAQRRELLALAVEATSTLQERDRRIVAHGADVSLDTLAADLGVSRDAAQRARHRAMARFELAFQVLAKTRTEASQ